MPKIIERFPNITNTALVVGLKEFLAGISQLDLIISIGYTLLVGLLVIIVVEFADKIEPEQYP
jgi:hypothetical protein